VSEEMDALVDEMNVISPSLIIEQLVFECILEEVLVRSLNIRSGYRSLEHKTNTMNEFAIVLPIWAWNNLIENSRTKAIHVD
jgi:hypothetical protein